MAGRLSIPDEEVLRVVFQAREIEVYEVGIVTQSEDLTSQTLGLEDSDFRLDQS